MKFENQTFENEEVLLDGNEFRGCTFRNCRIRYMGVTGIALHTPSFEQCSWSFAGPAANTVNFLAALYSLGGGARQLIEHTINNIKAGHYDPAILS